MSGQALIPALLSFVVVTDLRASNSTLRLRQTYSSPPSDVKDVDPSFQTMFVQHENHAQNKSDFENVVSDFDKQTSSNRKKTSRSQNLTNDLGKISDLFSTGPAHSTQHEMELDNLFSNQHEASSSIRTTPDPNFFRRYVLVGSYSMDSCLRDRGKLQYKVLHMEIFVKHYVVESDDFWFDTSASRLECDVDMVVPENMVVKVQVVRLNSTCRGVNSLQVLEIPSLNTLVDVCISTSIAGEFSLSNRVTVKVMVNKYRTILGRPRPFVLHLNLMAVTPANELEVDTLKGFVQTPRWDGRVYYPHNMNSKVVVNVPPHHSVMLSFQSFNVGTLHECQDDYLKLSTERSSSKRIGLNLDWLCDDSFLSFPKVYNTTALHFMFVSDDVIQHEGFRAIFSFHNMSASPKKSDGGLWNCSVPYWPDFRHHFPCNLQSDCVNSEDEVDCEYITETCGVGVITAGDGCYLLLKARLAKTSYHFMNEMCRASGGYLASLNTQQEWLHVLSVLHGRHIEKILVGLQPSLKTWPSMYRNLFRWADGSVAYFLRIYTIPSGNLCAYIVDMWMESDLMGNDCNIQYSDNTHKYFLCEIETVRNTSVSATAWRRYDLTRQPDPNLVTCPSGHVTHNFLACDVHSHCWVRYVSYSFSCHAPLASLLPHFACADGVGRVPYSLVCDHRQDCRDNSDEDFCVFRSCERPGDFQCNNGQCILAQKICDGQQRCLDDTESTCSAEHQSFQVTAPPPNIIDLDELGRLTVGVTPLTMSSNGSVNCPGTHFQCPLKDYYCLPIYLRCNGINDCPGHEDEAGCDSYTCVGFYRCRASRVCVHPNHLCDGFFQCPQHDDELLCDLVCPENCTCYGLALTCAAPFLAEEIPDLRYLDARGTFMNFSDVANNTMLIYLSLAECGLTYFPEVVLPNLHTLNLSGNLIRSINDSHLKGSPNLKVLSLSGNRLSTFYATPSPRYSFFSLLVLDLSKSLSSFLDVSNLTMFPNLQVLNLSGSGVDRVSTEGFELLTRLQVLDLRGCSVTEFPRNILKNLEELRLVYADNYKLCCPATLPAGFRLSDCYAPSDEISSCDTLLRSDFFRMFLYVFAAMALIGNAGSFVYRVVVNRTKCNQGFGVFVTHLCLSDFLMGLYLTIIGVADRMFQGDYLWEDVSWRNSIACKAAGFFSLLSSETSAFIICLITVDRFLVLRFPFSQIHFEMNSARTACLLAWFAGLLLALAPLLPMTSHWDFYKQSSICIPLPVTRQYFEGFAYSFGVFIVLNSVLFLLIAAGQAFIYHSIKMNSISMADTSKSSTRELTIARRLITIAMSDFLCWFPIGFLGVLASLNIPIPGEVNVGMAIFVLPLNSAINPFLYTLNVIKERRQRAQLKRLQTLLQNKIQVKGLEASVVDQQRVVKTAN